MEIECLGARTIVKFRSRKCCKSRYYSEYTLREGLGAAKLFVGVSRNDVTVNNKGGATCISTKQIPKASSLVIKLIQILP